MAHVEIESFVAQTARLIDGSRALLVNSRRIAARSHERVLDTADVIARSRGLLVRHPGDGPAPPDGAERSGRMPARPAFDGVRDRLARHHWRALRAIGSSGSTFEPLARYRGVGSRIAAWLAERGLVEIGRGPQDRRFGLCYRITALGRMVLERGRAPSS